MNENEFKIIFTELDFKVDNFVNFDELTQEEKKLYSKIMDDKYLFAYNLAFELNTINSQSIQYLKHLTNIFLNKVIINPSLNFVKEKVDINFSENEIDDILEDTPYLIGKEFINKKWLQNHFRHLNEVFYAEINTFNGGISEYFQSKNKKIIVPSRIYFHLVENKKENKYPFAFLATYSELKDGKVVYYPLKFALTEFKSDKNKLNKLISSITDVSKDSEFIRNFINSGEIFYPLNFTEEEAYIFLKELDIYEQNGIICRIPNWWASRKSGNKITIDIKEKLNEGTGMMNPYAIISIVPSIIYNGIEISKQEITELLNRNEGLANIKGKWIDNDHQKLRKILNEYEYYSKDGTSLSEILQIMSGVKENENGETIGIEFTRKDWLKRFIDKQFSSDIQNNLSRNFNGILRPYQYDAFKWLYGMNRLNFGVCLADDMGLGKTIELLSFLDKYKEENGKNVLLIVPASLIENWKSEIRKFTPDIDCFVLRGQNQLQFGKTNAFLTITTYQTAVKSEYLDTINWDIVILDEAQAIKNSDTQTTRKIKKLNTRMRIALTGTPIENNLLNLWSIFDFINPGLLGTRKQFKDFSRTLELNFDNFSNFKSIIEPFILRRLKTDKSIINDLPDKLENDIIINLSKEQVILYKERVSELEETLKYEKSEFEKKGKVLNAIMALKQICNHPSQYLGKNDYKLEESGKFIELKSICETIYEKREKVLVFTQFKEIIPALNNLLKEVFKQEGYCIDGDTSLANRNLYVNNFQNKDIPYMILSVKTGGVGLNLTSAQNVIHFDRWWNPAVEDQATDRTYRIGQKNNVSVYKFISANTIEDIINQMLKVKKDLADKYINSISNDVLNKLSTEELLNTMYYRGDDYE